VQTVNPLPVNVTVQPLTVDFPPDSILKTQLVDNEVVVANTPNQSINVFLDRPVEISSDQLPLPVSLSDNAVSIANDSVKVSIDQVIETTVSQPIYITSEQLPLEVTVFGTVPVSVADAITVKQAVSPLAVDVSNQKLNVSLTSGSNFVTVSNAQLVTRVVNSCFYRCDKSPKPSGSQVRSVLIAMPSFVFKGSCGGYGQPLTLTFNGVVAVTPTLLFPYMSNDTMVDTIVNFADGTFESAAMAYWCANEQWASQSIGKFTITILAHTITSSHMSEHNIPLVCGNETLTSYTCYASLR
jgi:hypothetical protein